MRTTFISFLIMIGWSVGRFLFLRFRFFLLVIISNLAIMITKHLLKTMIGGCFLIFLLGINSCIETFQPELNTAKQALVIDGQLTNLPGPYTVNLRLSSDPYTPTLNPLERAKVTIIEENGIEEILEETEPGIYKTSINGIQGIAGNRYKITIQTNDGKNYESPFEELKTPVAIEALSPVLETRFFEDAGSNVDGFQFYLNTGPSQNEEEYLLWFQRGTYKYQSVYPLAALYDGGLFPVADPFEFKTCYATHFIKELKTYNTANLQGNSIQNFPLYFLRSDTRFLEDRYSLLVQQFTLTKEGYDFWKKLEEQIATLGSLYATQPFRVRGNLKNTADLDEETLGYFTVAGVSETRVFVDRPLGSLYQSLVCTLDNTSYLRAIRTPSLWPANIYQATGGGRFFFENGCIDCRNVGGSIEVPDFWE